jgi:hypothetical protein
MTVVSALRGQRDRAKKLLRVYLIFAGVYLGVASLVWLVTPVRVLKIGESQCSDDWCIAVERAQRVPADGGDVYDVTLRMSSRAQGVARRENNLTLYLTEEHGARIPPDPEELGAPLNVLLKPGQRAIAKRRFRVPNSARDLSLVVAHAGRLPGWLIIGGDPFDGRTEIRLP